MEARQVDASPSECPAVAGHDAPADDATGVDARAVAPLEAAIRDADPMDLVRAVEASGRFRRDTRLGGIFHRGKISFREVSATESLHVSIDGSRLSVHVDDVCPLNLASRRRSQYAYARVVAHLISGMFADAQRRIRGRHGSHRCHLECEMAWVPDEPLDTDSKSDGPV